MTGAGSPTAGESSPVIGFGDRLGDVIARRGPLCVGIDPHPALLTAWDLPLTAAGLRRFALGAVAALAGEVAAVKPQSAFFEAYGAAGVTVLEEVLAAATALGALTVLDVKRGDIGSTVAGYAAAYLADGAPLAADSVTLSPYLGVTALTPALEAAVRSGRGIFVVAATSNPDGASVQQAIGGNGRTVAQTVIDDVAEWNAEGERLGPIGVVVGATVPPGTVDLSSLRGPVLAPGLGTQGAHPADLGALFGGVPGVLPSISRGVLRHGPNSSALRTATLRLRDELVKVLAEGNSSYRPAESTHRSSADGRVG